MITEINLTGAVLLKDERKKLLSRRFSQFVQSENRDQWDQHFLNVLRRDGRQSCELDIQRSDGSLFPARITSLKTGDSLSSHTLDDPSHPASNPSTSLNLRIVIVDITEQKRADAERIDYLKRLEQASRHLVAVQEDARRRLSSELHDRTSPNLAAIGINLSIIATELPPEVLPNLAERLKDTRTLIKDTADSIREICADMRPPLLDYAGLAAAIEGYALTYTRRSGIAVKFDCDNHDIRITPDLESLLFRIFQETLTNCVKHAQATSIMVKLNHGSRPITLTMSDNGIGFDPARLGETGSVGLGLLNMREMAEVAGGKFTVESHPGQGTRITVKVM